MKLIPSALLLLSLIALPAYGASLRMDALGTGLVGIIDDPGTDMTEYPEGNTFRTDWLTGLELQAGDWYSLRFLKPGPFSIGADLDAYLSTGGQPYLKIPVSFRAAGLGWGAAVDLPRWYPLVLDTTYDVGTNVYYPRFTGGVMLGTCWSSRGLRLDARLAIDVERMEIWVDTGAGARHHQDLLYAAQVPSLRLTVDHGDLMFRAFIRYARSANTFTDTANGMQSEDLSVCHSFTPCVGIVYRPGQHVTVAVALKPNVALWTPWSSGWTWSGVVPAGVEWTTGILTARVGVALGTASDGYKFNEVPSFRRSVTAGLAVKPVPRLTLDFNPSVDDLSNLTEWQLGATYTF
jgi:hypothetical protein